MTGSRFRAVSFRVLAALLLVLLLMLWGFGVVIFALAWLPDQTVLEVAGDMQPSDMIHRVQALLLNVLVWGIIVGVALQSWKPQRRLAPLLQALAVPTAIIAVELLAGTNKVDGSLAHLVPLSILAVLHPRSPDLVRVKSLDRSMTILVGVAAIPWLVYAANQLELEQLNHDPAADVFFWNVMGAFAVVVLLWGLIGASDRSGWRVTAWMTSVASIIFGVQSLMFPEAESTATVAWAVAAILWGVTYLAAAERRDRLAAGVPDPQPIDVGDTR